MWLLTNEKTDNYRMSFLSKILTSDNSRVSLLNKTDWFIVMSLIDDLKESDYLDDDYPHMVSTRPAYPTNRLTFGLGDLREGLI